MLIIPTNNIALVDSNLDLFNIISDLSKKLFVKFRIILPINSKNLDLPDQFNNDPNIQIRFTRFTVNRVLLLIVDRKCSLTFELIDDLVKGDSKTMNKYQLLDEQLISPQLAIFDTLWEELDSQKKLSLMEKAREDFVNICAHEIRTPIHPILFLSNLLSEKLKDTENSRIIKIINKNARILQQLADDLLDVTKIESNTLRLNKQKLNINEFLHELIGEFKESKLLDIGLYTIEKQPNEPSTEIYYIQPQDRIFFLNVDKNRLRQVIYNLLNNAFKSNNGQGEIRLNLMQRTRDMIEISIKDNGHAIDKDLLPKLFSKMVTGYESGNGLGLYICKNIIELQGGEIWAENNKNNIGSTFHISIPFIEQQELDLISYATRRQGHELQYRSHVLLVNNNDDFSNSITSALDKYGFHVNTVNESCAIKDFVSGYYVFALIDMNNDQSFEIARELVKLDYKIRIFFLTSGGTNYEPLRQIYNIPDTYKFIKKYKNIEKVINQLGIIKIYDTKI